MVRYVAQFNKVDNYSMTCLDYCDEYGYVRTDADTDRHSGTSYEDWDELCIVQEGCLLPFKLELIYDT